MRAVATAVALAFLTIGCVTTYRMKPAAGGKVGRVEAFGLQLLADPDAWHSKPFDLPEYLTPIRVQIVNGTDKDIAVRYDDFSLTDENGFRYAAINPYGNAPPDSPTSPAPPTPPASPVPPVPPAPPPRSSFDSGSSSVELVIYRPSSGGGQRAPWHSGPHHSIYARDHVGVDHNIFFRDRGAGFFIAPGFGFNFGFYSAWPYAFYYPPDYGAFVYPWGYPYYPHDPTEDVLRAGLPEGVLQPNGHVSGFVYFQNAGAQGHELFLTWLAHTAAGEQIGELSVAFKVEH